MRTVADHAQFVVQIVFTTSSKTVGLRIIRPAPVVTQARSGSDGGGCVEGAEVLVEPEHVRDRGAKTGRGSAPPESTRILA